MIVKKHLVVFVVTGLCIAYGILDYFIPPHYTWFELHRNIMAIGVLILGIAIFPVSYILYFTGSIWQVNAIVAFLGFAFTGIVAGKIIQAIWRRGWLGKIIIAVALILNSGFGLFLLAWADVLVKENPSSGCQAFITSEQGLRIITFDQRRIMPGSYNFYLYTSDGGKTWRQLFFEIREEIGGGNCQNVGALSNNFFWIWGFNNLRITHDRGLTWDKWDGEFDWYGLIQQVIFQDETVGSMQVFDGKNEISEVITLDGGKSWKPQK